MDDTYRMNEGEHEALRAALLESVERRPMTAPDNACPVEQVLLDIEALLQATPERSDFVDDLAQQQDEALCQIHELSQTALKALRDRDALARQRTLPPVAEVMERRDDIRRSIQRQLGTDPFADRIILQPTDWDIVLAALTNLQTGSAPLTDAGDGGEKG